MSVAWFIVVAISFVLIVIGTLLFIDLKVGSN